MWKFQLSDISVLFLCLAFYGVSAAYVDWYFPSGGNLEQGKINWCLPSMGNATRSDRVACDVRLAVRVARRPFFPTVNPLLLALKLGKQRVALLSVLLYLDQRIALSTMQTFSQVVITLKGKKRTFLIFRSTWIIWRGQLCVFLRTSIF